MLDDFCLDRGGYFCFVLPHLNNSAIQPTSFSLDTKVSLVATKTGNVYF